ncbi:hypothetical protein ACJZ2D_003587 [Fusarium nematophilum]
MPSSRSKSSKKGAFRRFMKMLFGCCTSTDSEPSACESQRPRGPREISLEKASARVAELEKLCCDVRVCEVSRRPKDIRPPKTVRFDTGPPRIIPVRETPPYNPDAPHCPRQVPGKTLRNEIGRSSRSDSPDDVFVDAAEYLNRDGQRVFRLVKPVYRGYPTLKSKGKGSP